jgi:CRISPR/Cas system-associated exonuclease Cas4 (RecB family)
MDIKTIRSCSFSRLSVYGDCPLHAKLKFLDKIPELERPVNPKPTYNPNTGEIEHANERGSRIHESADDFINKRTDLLIPELQAFKTEFASARLLKSANPDLIETEQTWAFDEKWGLLNPSYKVNPYPYLRIIIDLLIFTNSDRTHARVIDFKSGKRRNNEIKHASQTQLYGTAAFKRFPQLETITTELWYVDTEKEPVKTEFTRAQCLRFEAFWDRKMKKMTEDTEFKAKPHIRTCMFCPYGKKEHSNKWVNKSGDCQLSMDKKDYL